MRIPQSSKSVIDFRMTVVDYTVVLANRGQTAGLELVHQERYKIATIEGRECFQDRLGNIAD